MLLTANDCYKRYGAPIDEKAMILIRKWFTQQMHNMIVRRVELLLNRF